MTNVHQAPIYAKLRHLERQEEQAAKKQRGKKSETRRNGAISRAHRLEAAMVGPTTMPAQMVVVKVDSVLKLYWDDVLSAEQTLSAIRKVVS